MITSSLIQTFHLNDQMFLLEDVWKNRDNCNYPFRLLKQYFQHIGVDLSTCDINIPEKSDLIIYHRLNQDFIDYGYDKSYLLIMESPLHDPEVIDTTRHHHFKKIFTWNDDLIDNKKYFKVNYAFDMPQEIPKQFHGKKFCCTIAGNKMVPHPNELYSKRIEFIKWFETNHPEEFDLYGTKWVAYDYGTSIFAPLFKRLRSKRLRKYFAKPYPSFKGKVESKFETMKNYKFAICYENICNLNGYVTEKIFDCFFAGCVPIYWGASNITQHIPKKCFIDQRDFSSFEETYDFLCSIDEEQYMTYLNHIESFLKSDKANPFKAETFAKTIVTEIEKDIVF